MPSYKPLINPKPCPFCGTKLLPFNPSTTYGWKERPSYYHPAPTKKGCPIFDLVAGKGILISDANWNNRER